MLILTRKAGEAITIGDQIKIRVVEVMGNHIKLGFEAPADYRIYREEVYLKIKEQNQLATCWDLNEFQKAVTLFNNENKET
jgi:carbon storage regulator